MAYFRDWLSGDGYPFWPFWENLRSWWAIRHLPNVMLIHFNELKENLPGQLRWIAEFLRFEPSPDAWERIERHASSTT